MRYVRELGRFGIGRVMEPVWIVVETDDHAGAIARGFVPIDNGLSDPEVKRRYGVERIYRVELSADVN